MSIVDLPDSDGHHLPLKLTWQSIDPAQNRYRYYVLRVDEDLWGHPCIIRRWGRIGAHSLQERYIWPASEAELERGIRQICRAREYHGYELLGNH
ncbi:MAG: WGR domain-containing protein [Salinibacter sp.]